MALLFYTTDYKPERAQAEIQKLLLGMGARRMSLEYDKDRAVVGMSFTLETAAGEREFLLPSRVDRVLDTLKRQGVLKSTRPNEHAAAVAWRTLPDEIMLPYLLLPGDRPGETHTLYEQFSADRALPKGD